MVIIRVLVGHSYFLCLLDSGGSMLVMVVARMGRETKGVGG